MFYSYSVTGIVAMQCTNARSLVNEKTQRQTRKHTHTLTHTHIRRTLILI